MTVLDPFTCCPAAALTTAGYTYSGFADVTGNDIAGVANTQSTPYACASVCTAQPSCVGFTWAASTSVGGATCWPKSAAPALAASSTALFFARESSLQTLVVDYGQSSFSSIG